MQRCAIVINSGHPAWAVTKYVTDPATKLNDVDFKHIPSLHSFIRRHNISSKYLPPVEKLGPLHRVNLAIFGCHVQLLGTEDDTLIEYINDEMKALEDLADRLERGRRVSRRQQTFLNTLKSGNGNGAYWPWFTELKSAVEVVELTV